MVSRPIALRGRDGERLAQLLEAGIATHVIEHLSEGDLAKLLLSLHGYEHAYIEVPLHEDRRTDWTGGTTTHVLTWSVQEIDDAFRAYGLGRAGSQINLPKHGVPSISRWYSRE